MCGIIGVIDTRRDTGNELLGSMLFELRHRGPDDSGEYIDSQDGIALAQQRLSLIDLSPNGHQPMIIGDLVVVYNGEIYNYQDIKLELEQQGVYCTGDSDTEVLLRAWQFWGESAIDKFRGMFAFAVWDKKIKKLHLYRDRVGVKPLYYYHKDNLFIFASEIKAILKHPEVKRKVNNDAVSLFLQLGYVPAPHSIFCDIKKVEAGCCLVVDRALKLEKKRYWNLDNSYQISGQNKTEAEVLADLEDRIVDSFKLRMIADVPVGVFLSGGIDSSLVTAILKKNGYENLSTYTIGFSEASHDESQFAEAVAKHLQTKHHTLRCTTKDAQAIVPLLAHIFDEPFADASAIPTYLVSKFAKNQVTAALSADGGDELFGGYTRYKSAQNISQKFSRLPGGLGVFIKILSGIVSVLAGTGLLRNNWSHKLKKAELFYRHRRDLLAVYAVLNSYFSNDEVSRLVKTKGQVFVDDLYKSTVPNKQLSSQRVLQHTDFCHYLPDDVLVKVDRASMAVSLEGREPFLDHTLIEFAAGIPDEIMHKEKGNKYLLRKLLYKYMPQGLVDRPKQGFGVPLSSWLKNDLRYLLDEFLSPEAVLQTELLNYDFVLKEKDDFLKGRQPYNRVWNMIVLQMWCREYLK